MPLTFGQYIAKRRKELGLSQKELANRIQKEDGSTISPQYLNDIERDRRNPPSDFLLREFAKVLGVREDFLSYLAEALPSDVKGLSDDPERVARAFRAFRSELGRKS
jgi:transcriptional regulator with XRE-family HTH domain